MTVKALSLSLAIVGSSDAPLLLLDADLNVLAASASFFRVFRIDPLTAEGGSVFDLGSGEWDMPKLRSLLTATAAGNAAIDAYELDLKRPGEGGRRLVIKAQKLNYDDPAAERLLLTVSDVTEARIAEKLKDDLLQENALLLQEIQHRFANSLQVIASVLMQSARKVQSEETRLHLHDAHSRVMSIATVQRQLVSSPGGEVALRPYFTQLCQSLGASMIRDHDKQSIVVAADDKRVGADVSISLGLIVTELVINALKHAFPNERDGQIHVNYQSDGHDWALSVSDDGVGMPPACRQGRSRSRHKHRRSARPATTRARRCRERASWNDRLDRPGAGGRAWRARRTRLVRRGRRAKRRTAVNLPRSFDGRPWRDRQLVLTKTIVNLNINAPKSQTSSPNPLISHQYPFGSS